MPQPAWWIWSPLLRLGHGTSEWAWRLYRWARGCHVALPLQPACCHAHRPTCIALHYRYECTVCTTGASATCTVAPQCSANADGTCQCTLLGLEPATPLNLTCVAIKADGTKSPGSSTKNTTTDLAP